jgi:hypothetical protein
VARPHAGGAREDRDTSTPLSDNAGMAEDLATEQARLEREIAALELSLSRSQARLAAERAWPPKPRGLLAGTLVGAAIFAVLFGLGVLFALGSIARMD